MLADLAEWSRLDLRPRKYRRKHPYLSAAELVLRWLTSSFDVACWRDVLPKHVQAFVRAHETLKPATLQSYVKALRKWLRWHERDEINAPILSSRMRGICPAVETDDPFVVEEEVWRYILHRSRWVYAGSTALKCQQGKRHRVASMAHWRPGGFYLWLMLGSELGLRPWELAFLRRDEIHLDARVPHVMLINHAARDTKTALAGTRLKLTAELADELRAYLDQPLPGDTTAVRHGMLFAVRCKKAPSGYKPPYYDQVWLALRQETGLPLNGRIVRRRHATATAARNPNMFEVIRATRHARVETLVKHYLQRHGGKVIDPATGKMVESG